MDPDTVFNEENYGGFVSFVLINHWHYKNVFGGGLTNSVLEPTDIMKLQRSGNIFLDEYRKEKLCTIESSKAELNKNIQIILDKISEKKK